MHEAEGTLACSIRLLERRVCSSGMRRIVLRISYGGYERTSAFNVKLRIKSPIQVVGTDLEREVLHPTSTLQNQE